MFLHGFPLRRPRAWTQSRGLADVNGCFVNGGVETRDQPVDTTVTDPRAKCNTARALPAIDLSLSSLHLGLSYFTFDYLPDGIRIIWPSLHDSPASRSTRESCQLRNGNKSSANRELRRYDRGKSTDFLTLTYFVALNFGLSRRWHKRCSILMSNELTCEQRKNCVKTQSVSIGQLYFGRIRSFRRRPRWIFFCVPCSNKNIKCLFGDFWREPYWIMHVSVFSPKRE